MSKQATKQASKPAKTFTPFYATTVEGKKVEIVHLIRRRYGVLVGGKAAGYITSKDPLNAAGRVATVAKLAELKLHS